MVWWYDARLACGRARDQTPVCPFQWVDKQDTFRDLDFFGPDPNAWLFVTIFGIWIVWSVLVAHPFKLERCREY